jgi:hypothetical protein
VELGVENVVGSYDRAERDACVNALPNGGRLNRVFEKAGVTYGPRPKPGTKAAKKRKADDCIRSARKQKKVAGIKKMATTPKGMAASKAGEAPKVMATAAPRIASAPSKAAASKSTAPPKASAPKAAAMKGAALAASGTVSGAIASKVTAARQKGAPGAMRAGVLKIKTRMKRPTSVEPSLGQATGASSFVPASTQRVVASSPPTHRSDDDQVENCLMLGVASTTSSPSSSSRKWLASESARAS